jgi:hypothetical protein
VLIKMLKSSRPLGAIVFAISFFGWLGAEFLMHRPLTKGSFANAFIGGLIFAVLSVLTTPTEVREKFRRK